MSMLNLSFQWAPDSLEHPGHRGFTLLKCTFYVANALPLSLLFCVDKSYLGVSCIDEATSGYDGPY